MDPRDQVRLALERALNRVQRERIQGPLQAPAVPFPRREMFLEAQGLLPGEGEAMAAHLARAHLRSKLAPLRAQEDAALAKPQTYERETREGHAWLGVLARGEAKPALAAQLSRAYGLSDGAPVERAHRSAARWYSGLREEASGLGAHPDASEKSLDGMEVLRATDDLLAELRSRFGVEDAEAWPAALREHALDAAHPSADRHRRVASALEGTALFEALARCAQVSTGQTARAQVVPLRPGERIQVTLAGHLRGVAADYSAAHAAGRALGYALIDRRAPAALRWPVVGSMSRAMGALLAHTLLATKGRLSRRERALKHMRLAALWVLDVRVAAASLVAPAEPDLRLELIARALGAPARPLSTWMLRTPSARARLRGLHGGLALFVSLREHFDEDWFRNPRSADFLRECCRAGGGESVEGALAQLGGSPDNALLALREMIP